MIGSFTYTEKIVLKTAHTTKASTTASPLVQYRINDWASIYGVVGVGYSKFQQTENQGLNPHCKQQRLQLLYLWRGSAVQPNQTLLWTSPEQSRIRNV